MADTQEALDASLAKLDKASAEAGKISSKVTTPKPNIGANSAISKVDAKQKAIENKQAQDSSVDALESMAKSEESIADSIKGFFKRGEKKESGPGFIKRGISSVQAKVAATKELGGGSFLKGLMKRFAPFLAMGAAAIIALVAWWTAAQNHDGGMIGWLWDKIVEWTPKILNMIVNGIVTIVKAIDGYVKDNYGDWGGFFKVMWKKYLGYLSWLWEGAKGLWKKIDETVTEKFGGWLPFFGEILKVAGGVVDWVLEALFGRNWGEAKIFWVSNWDFFMNWWDKVATKLGVWWNYVEASGGIGSYMLDKIGEGLLTLLKYSGYGIITQLTDKLLETLFGASYKNFKDGAFKKLGAWWTDVQKEGGLLTYVNNALLDWWDNMVMGWNLDWMPWGIGQDLKNTFMTDGGNGLVSRQNARVKAAEDYEKKLEDEKKIEDKYKSGMAGADNTYISNKNKIYNNINQGFKALDDVSASKSAKRMSGVNTSGGLMDPTGEKGRSTYTGRNAQPFMKVITSKYGVKEGIRAGRGHGGVDFRADMNTPITSITDGTVEKVEQDKKGGTVLVIDDPNGKRILYMHLNSVNVKKGDIIEKGQLIAKSGNSGSPSGGGKYVPHLHLGVKDGSTTIDPLTYINSLQQNTTMAGSDNIQVAQGGAVNNQSINVAGATTIAANNVGTSVDTGQVKAINNLTNEVNKMKNRTPQHILSNGVSEITM